MGTRTYSRRRADGTRVMTALGRAREASRTAVATPAGLAEEPVRPNTRTRAVGANTEALGALRERFGKAEYDRTAPTEEVVLLDADGNTLYQKNDNATSEVQWRDIDSQILRQARLVTHNHPKATSFSANDVISLVDAGWQALEARGNPLTADEQQVMQEFTASMLRELAPKDGKITASGKSTFASKEEMVSALQEFSRILAEAPVRSLTYTLQYNGRPNLQVAKSVAMKLQTAQKAIIENTNIVQLASSLTADIMRSRRISYTRASELANLVANIVVQHVAVESAIKGRDFAYQIDID